MNTEQLELILLQRYAVLSTSEDQKMSRYFGCKWLVSEDAENKKE